MTAKASGTFLLGGDLPIHRLGFGAMRITGKGIWGNPPDHDEAIRVLKRLPALDINFIDTADSYGPNVSEDLIREALHPYGDIVVATKGGLTRHGPDRAAPHGTVRWGPIPSFPSQGPSAHDQRSCVRSGHRPSSPFSP